MSGEGSGETDAAFDGPPRRAATDAPDDPDAAFVVDLDVFEGPLDLLLSLARSQKVDLAEISIAALAEAYLGWLAEARRRRLDVAADHLVTAAWLAYLKSRLLVPAEEAEEPPADELARDLAFRLKRLEAMRAAAERLFAGTLVGRDVFLRGSPEPTVATRTVLWQADLKGLLEAYVGARAREIASEMHIARRRVWSLVDARERLERLVGRLPEWVTIESVMAMLPDAPDERRTVLASTFGASLELAREGDLELSQPRPFGPLYVRARSGGGRAGPAAGEGDGEGAADGEEGA